MSGEKSANYFIYNDWLAPFQNWLKDAQRLGKIASDSDFFAKKVCAKEIFGSNLRLGRLAIHSEKTIEKSAEKPLSTVLVGPVGLEPTTNGL